MAGKKQIDDLRPGGLVEIACRLVGEKNGRVWCKRAGKGDTLLLAAGKLDRIVPSPLAQAHRGKLVCRTVVSIVESGKFQRHGDVFQRRHGGNEMKGLKNNADIASTEAR